MSRNTPSRLKGIETKNADTARPLDQDPPLHTPSRLKGIETFPKILSLNVSQHTFPFEGN